MHVDPQARLSPALEVNRIQFVPLAATGESGLRISLDCTPFPWHLWDFRPYCVLQLAGINRIYFQAMCLGLTVNRFKETPAFQLN